MVTPTTIELWGENGAYLGGRVLRSGRLKVLDSNVLPEGSIIEPEPDITWEEGARWHGRVTVLTPADLLESILEDEDEGDWGDDLLDDYLTRRPA